MVDVHKYRRWCVATPNRPLLQFSVAIRFPFSYVYFINRYDLVLELLLHELVFHTKFLILVKSYMHNLEMPLSCKDKISVVISLKLLGWCFTVQLNRFQYIVLNYVLNCWMRCFLIGCLFNSYIFILSQKTIRFGIHMKF